MKRYRFTTELTLAVFVILAANFAVSVYTQTISNSRGYYEGSFLFLGSAVQKNQTGAFSFSEWAIDAPIILFWENGTLRAASADLLVSGLFPYHFQPVSELVNSSYAQGWQVGGGSGEVVANRFLELDLAPTAPYLSVYLPSAWLPPMNTSSINAIRIDVTRVFGGTWKLNLLVNNVWWGLRDTEGALVHNSSGVFTYILPPDLSAVMPTLSLSRSDSANATEMRISALEIGRMCVVCDSESLRILVNNKVLATNIASEPRILQGGGLSIRVPISLLGATNRIEFEMRDLPWQISSVALSVTPSLSARPSFSYSLSTIIEITLPGLSIVLLYLTHQLWRAMPKKETMNCR